MELSKVRVSQAEYDRLPERLKASAEVRDAKTDDKTARVKVETAEKAPSALSSMKNAENTSKAVPRSNKRARDQSPEHTREQSPADATAGSNIRESSLPMRGLDLDTIVCSSDLPSVTETGSPASQTYLKVMASTSSSVPARRESPINARRGSQKEQGNFNKGLNRGNIGRVAKKLKMVENTAPVRAPTARNSTCSPASVLAPRKGSTASTTNSSRRSSTSLPFTSMDMSKIGRISKKPKFIDTTAPAVAAEASALNKHLPYWYKEAKPEIRCKDASERPSWDRLKSLRDLILRCIAESTATPSLVDGTIAQIHGEIEHLRLTDVTPEGLKRYNMLEDDKGLPQIFKEHVASNINFPWYVGSDAEGLHKAWMKGLLDGSNIFRGIETRVKQNDRRLSVIAFQRGGIDRDFKIDWRFHGEGHLVNGSWFASQKCAVRDGCHGSSQGGVSGIAGKGATSISLSGSMYAEYDKDKLDNIWYSGTKQTKKDEKEATASTQLLLDSANSHLPIRVIRSSYLPPSNPYRPDRGFRYDGLYKVVGHKVVDKKAQHYVFHLRRLPQQMPVRYKGPEKRPSAKEIEQFDIQK